MQPHRSVAAKLDDNRRLKIHLALKPPAQRRRNRQIIPALVEREDAPCWRFCQDVHVEKSRAEGGRQRVSAQNASSCRATNAGCSISYQCPASTATNLPPTFCAKRSPKRTGA